MDLVIKNKEFKKQLNNIGIKDWLRLARQETLLIIDGGSGSHYINIRDPKYSDPQDIKGLIVTITPNCYKQVNIKILKKFINFGIKEADIWKALGMLK